jgi:GxxExxY protein
VIGAFYEAYNEVGVGFVEPVYQQALAITLDDAKVRFVREPSLVVRMRGRPIGLFRPDFLVEGRLILEVKVARAIEERHRVQLLNYLRATDAEVGLLLNFGPRPMFERMVLSNSRKRARVHRR